ncbi:MAG: T9SS type A sorting domain-containing protein [Edaphocola sp.]
MGGYQVEQGLMQLCCVNYVSKPGNGGIGELPENNAKSYLKIYPNPSSRNTGIMLHYQFKEAGRAWATIYNINGQVMKTMELPFADNTKESYCPISLQNLHLSPGVYYIRLSNGGETLGSKFVLTQ